MRALSDTYEDREVNTQAKASPYQKRKMYTQAKASPYHKRRKSTIRALSDASYCKLEFLWNPIIYYGSRSSNFDQLIVINFNTQYEDAIREINSQAIAIMRSIVKQLRSRDQ